MGRKAFHTIRVGKDGGPIRAPFGIVVELPDVDQLMHHARVSLEGAKQLRIMTPFCSAGYPHWVYSLTASAIVPTCRVEVRVIDWHRAPSSWHRASSARGAIGGASVCAG